MTVSARNICLSQFASILYVLRNDGVVTRQYRTERPLITPIGFTSSNLTSTVNIRYDNFGTILRIMPTSTSTFIRPGVYSISYGFSMGITSTTGECTSKCIKYGLSTTDNDYMFSAKVEPYSITFNDSSTWQSFNSNTVVVITTNTLLNITTVLLNNPVADPTDAYVFNHFINVVYISGLL
jgi:hypothetical protein